MTREAELSAVKMLCSYDLRSRGFVDGIPLDRLGREAMGFVWLATDWCLHIDEDLLEAASLLLSGWLPKNWGSP